ncbi:MAG: hypothetical protein P1U47_04595 [Zhongshania sp.]|uniref:hypothetical protein n=1 Tax=Zhongshania sp. TaxID=1971902 RepID=UPI00262613BB|nr:hypothetical protein [Zhongshania sp.]MDF1691625.1 hypothetical protein [Zhongshania sp.]
MLIASYLLGCDGDGGVRHLAVDNVIPEANQTLEYTLYPREALGGAEIIDLVLQFADAEEPRNIICLPALPSVVVNHILAGLPLQIVDFAYGRVVRLASQFQPYQQRCA